MSRTRVEYSWESFEARRRAIHEAIEADTPRSLAPRDPAAPVPLTVLDDAPYVELHLHSHYSLLEGASSIDELLMAAEAQGHRALALTDHEAMYGSMEFARSAKEAGLRPITGLELTVQEADGQRHHVTLLAETRQGYSHLCRLSSRQGVEMVRNAKAEGLPVTCDVSAHHLHLADTDIGYFDSLCHVIPPFRSERDRDALRAGLADGTLDALVSDHTPVDADAKTLPFGEAEPGATGLELLLSLALKWGDEPGVGLSKALARITCDPVRVLGDALGSLASSAGRLTQGGVADVCVFDPQAVWQVRPEALASQGKSTPFAFDAVGAALPARVRWTIVAGTVAHEAAAAAA